MLKHNSALSTLGSVVHVFAILSWSQLDSFTQELIINAVLCRQTLESLLKLVLDVWHFGLHAKIKHFLHGVSNFLIIVSCSLSNIDDNSKNGVEVSEEENGEAL